jgi:hypothetical protein
MFQTTNQISYIPLLTNWLHPTLLPGISRLTGPGRRSAPSGTWGLGKNGLNVGNQHMYAVYWIGSS